jgi:hypothetical protein
MALWGKADGIYSPGTIDVDYVNKTITGTATSFTAASVGDVISVGAGFTFGEAVISGITSDTYIAIATTESLSGAAIAGVAYSISQKPKYTLLDSHYEAAEIYGVDAAETAVSKTTIYSVTHGGWVGVQTYLDQHGTLRVKTETLVAMSSISAGGLPSYGTPRDAADDSVFSDAVITIVTQPASAGVGTTETATFSVTATIVPEWMDINYQWQEDDGGGFADLVGETSSSVSIGNTDATKDGYEYRVILTDRGGDVTVTSTAAVMTVS